jgi:hypothetical protein
MSRPWASIWPLTDASAAVDWEKPKQALAEGGGKGRMPLANVKRKRNASEAQQQSSSQGVREEGSKRGNMMDLI